MKILIIEDQFEIANMYRETLKENNIISDIAQTASEGLTKLNSTNYDLLLLDMNLPDMFGLNVLKDLKSRENSIGVIIITASNESDLLIKALNAGADDYLTKPINFAELIARTNAVYRRYNNTTNDEINVDKITINTRTQIILINGQEFNTTKKEYLLFLKLVSNYPGYVEKKELINAIYDEYYFDDSSAIRVHIYNLKRKLKNHNIELQNNKNKGYKLCLEQ